MNTVHVRFMNFGNFLRSIAAINLLRMTLLLDIIEQLLWHLFTQGPLLD